MIAIKVNNDFLDLPPNAAIQVERNTPLIMGDANLGELTFPLTIKATEKNRRLLGFITELGKLKTATEIKQEAEYHEHGLLQYRGTLMAEYVNINLNYPEQGDISIYFLTAISAFYSAAQNVMLHQVYLGGDREISGFTDHVAATWQGNADDYDYVFAPIKNDAYIIEDDEEDPEPLYTFINPVTVIEGVLFINFFMRSVNRITPFIYYRYLLIQCFKNFGYTISGDFLDDPDFKKAYAPNFSSLYWGYWYQETIIINGVPTQIPHVVINDPVVINLKNHVPKDYPVTKFLFSLANRFGLAYHIDVTRKHCVIRKLNNQVAEGVRKDYTTQAAPDIKEEFPKADKIYAIKQNFDPSDSLISTPDLDSYNRLPDIQTTADLPLPTAAYEKYIVLVIASNWFYICQLNPDTNGWEWNYLSDNIYDYEPTGNNETIETSITPVCQRVVKWRQPTVGNYVSASLPQIEQTGNWKGKIGEFVNWELRILFYHGLQLDPQGQQYPFSSSHHYNGDNVKVGNYSLALTPPEGLVEVFWNNWLKVLQSTELATLVLYLNIQQYMQLSWTDIILIRGVAFLITQQTPQSPYNNKLPCQAVRINVQYKAPVVACTAAVTDIVVQDMGNGTASITWSESSPDAVAWLYSIDGGQAVKVYVRSAVVTGLIDGAHTVQVVPLCSDDNANPAGAATQPFNITLPALKIQISAVLTNGLGGNNDQNKLRLTATSAAPVGQFFSFRFGQCVYNTSSNLQYCFAYPGASFPNDYSTVTFIVGDTTETVDSVIVTPGSSFGFIVKVVLHGLSGITAAQIEKAPGQSWVLEILP